MMYWKGKLLCGAMPFSYSPLFLFPSNNLFPPFITPFCNSFSLSHPFPCHLSPSDPFFMLQSIFSPPFAMVYCNLSPSSSQSVSALRDSLSLLVSFPYPVSLHIIYSSHPCSRSLLSLSCAIHLSLHLSPIKHHPSINLLSIPLFKVIAQSLSLSLCSNCLCDP